MKNKNEWIDLTSEQYEFFLGLYERYGDCKDIQEIAETEEMNGVKLKEILEKDLSTLKKERENGICNIKNPKN